MTDPDFLKLVRQRARKKQAGLGLGTGAESHGDAGRAGVVPADSAQFAGGSRETMAVPEVEQCCEGKVHIAYRGVSDDKMYISHDRGNAEIKYFRPNGLRIFCAGCRRRLY